MISLYFIGHYDDDGNNFDLIVEAPDPEQAVKIWQDNYWPIEDGWVKEDGIPDPEKIFLIEPTGKPGVIDWNLIKAN